jgi:ferredoxin
MRVVVDFDKCKSNAVCMGIAPEVFDVHDDDGFLYILQEEPPEELRPTIEHAIRDCPTGAISIEG